MAGFDEHPNGYSATNALFFAEASRLAYKDKDEIQKTVRGWGLDSDFAFFDKDEMQGFLASDAGKVVVAFRGTQVEKPNDVLADVKFRKVPGVFGTVHEGFNGAVDSLWPEVKARVGEVAGGKRLWLTGHSLGAAMAVITAARFVADGRDIEGVYSLGKPRAGDATFAKALDDQLPNRCFRIVNNIDPVPRVPPQTLGFRHEATRVYMTSAGQVIVNASVWKMLSDSLKTRFKNGFNFKSVGVDEHNTGRYIKVLQSAL